MNPRGTILTRGYLKITDDTRISTDRNVDEDWNIIIRNISFEDRGFYNCVINTAPFPSVNRVHLHVIGMLFIFTVHVESHDKVNRMLIN